VNARPLVTGYPLEAWETAFADLAERRVVKAALMPALR
jgi:hypothetical protein